MGNLLKSKPGLVSWVKESLKDTSATYNLDELINDFEIDYEFGEGSLVEGFNGTVELLLTYDTGFVTVYNGDNEIARKKWSEL